MPSKGFGRMFNAGPGMVNGVKKAQKFGRDLVDGTGPVAVAMKTLGLMEHFGDITEEIEKLENLEKRLHARINLAEKTLANAKRSPHLENTGSVDLLEGTMEDIQKYLNWLGSCGPLIRGASYDEMNARLGNMLVWVTDALVALQLDTMLAVTNGDVGGSMQQVAPEGHNPGDGGAPGQAVSPENQDSYDMMGQHLMPAPMHSAVPHPQQQQMVPMSDMLGTPQIPPALALQAAPRVTGAFAMPNGGAGWPNNAQAVPSMMVHHAPPAIPGGAPLGYNGIGWPNNPGAAFWTKHHTPSAAGVPISSNMDLDARTTPQALPSHAGREDERAMWAYHGDPSSFRSLAVTESVGSDGTISPAPSDSASEMTRKASWGGTDNAKLSHPSDNKNHDTRPKDEAPSNGPDTRSHHFDPTSYPRHQTRSVPHDQGVQRPHLSEPNSQVPAEIGGAFGQQVVYDSVGRPFYVDANTGHPYPAGWGCHPQVR